MQSEALPTSEVFSFVGLLYLFLKGKAKAFGWYRPIHMDAKDTTAVTFLEALLACHLIAKQTA